MSARALEKVVLCCPVLSSKTIGDRGGALAEPSDKSEFVSFEWRAGRPRSGKGALEFAFRSLGRWKSCESCWKGGGRFRLGIGGGAG